MKRFLWKLTKWFFGIIVGLCLTISLLLYIFKDDIINYVVEEVNKNLNAKVTVSKIDLTFWATFPNVSLDFNDVFIQDALPNATKRDTLLYSDLIRLKFNPIDLWNEKYDVKRVEIHPGTIQLKVDSKGKVNYDIVKKSKSSASSKFKLKLKEVQFDQIKFAYSNQATGQFYKTKVNQLNLSGEFTEKKFTLNAKSDLYINSLKSESIALLTNKRAEFDLQIKVNQEKNTFELPKTVLLISKLPFQVSGFVNPEQIKFDISAKKLKLAEVASKLSNQLDQINTFEGQGFFNFNLKIAGKNDKKVVPKMICNFDVQNGSLREPEQKLKFTGINLKGKYSNEAGKNAEFLKLWNLKFNTISGPFQGEFLLTNFTLPHYEGKAKGNVDLASIHGLFHLPQIDQITGNLDINSQFDIQTIQDESGQNELDFVKCSASLNLQNINASVINDTRTFKSLNGFVGIEGDEAAVQDIRVKIGKSDFKLNGIFQEIAPFIDKKGKLIANVDLQSNFIDVEDLSSKNSDKGAKIESEKAFVLPNNVDGTVLLNIGQLKYEKHLFNQLKSNLTVDERLLTFKELTLQNANATVNGDLVIEETSPEYLVLQSVLESNNIYFKPLFQEWNNFDQEVITENNIAGKAHINLQFKAPFDLRSGIIKNAIVAKAHISITDGALKSVSTFKSITESLKTSPVRFLLKKRNINDFEKKLLDLRFQTLENTIVIQNGKLEIPLMEIKSNALDIETFGWHTFDNQIDYHFAFRFRDLMTVERETEFGIVEDDGTGLMIFMRMHGTTDKPIIEWDEKAKKEQAKENREAAKLEALSILKTEFGFRKNDTTIGVYQPIKKPTEELRIDFNNAKETPTPEEPKESELKKKMREKINKLKESTKEEEIEFEVD
jgi:hypothetical protein